MFDKVLVANRGEIAVRVMRACDDLGVDTVAVYSDADKHGGHVRYADEAYNIGPARAADSYLDHDAVIEAAEKAGADAIHPGYGFLAENAKFAGKVESHDDITWVGPSAESMEQAGEKTKARRIMNEADVPIVPGTTDPVTTVDEVHEFGNEHGYPIAIKAEGGGGGSTPAVSVEGEVVHAEMQGTILEVNVSEGDTVEAGDVICVLEAMKMENDVVAEVGGTVAEVAVAEGDSVDQGDPLVVLD